MVRSGKLRRDGSSQPMTLRTLIALAMAVMPVRLALLMGCSEAQPSGPQQPLAKPQPSVVVSEVRMIEPRGEGEPYRVEATIQHETSGGPAGITFRLRNRASGENPQMPGRVQLTPGVALVAVGEIQAPRGDYTPEVEVNSRSADPLGSPRPARCWADSSRFRLHSRPGLPACAIALGTAEDGRYRGPAEWSNRDRRPAVRIRSRIRRASLASSIVRKRVCLGGAHLPRRLTRVALPHSS
jgi:hypothetical protein